jgi:endo-alpha-1,4-polygalactosaminidase (GH114 family)
VPGVHRCLLALFATTLAFAAIVASACSSTSTSATVKVQKVEAERLHVARGSGHVVRDASASGRRALVLTGRGAARIRVRVVRRSRLWVVARSARCAGTPRLVAAVDGAPVLTEGVKGRRWARAPGGPAIARGTHRIALRLANPHRAAHCRRSVRVDRLVFTDARQAATTPAAPATGAPGAASGTGAAGAAPATGGRPWIPPARATWQWQLSGALDQSVDAQVYDIDLFDNSASTVAALHAKGHRVVCYLDAGTYEPGRPDSGSFPAAVLGSAVDGWPGEKWLDVRRLDVLGPIINARLDLCRQKGFDGVEPDNVDGYANGSGFPLSAADQLAFNRYIATAAHARGLSVGLKNDLDQAAALQPAFDFAVNEQCFQYQECDQLRPFAAAGKAVFIAEYDLDPSAFCAQAQAAGYSAIRKHLALDAWRQTC